MGVPRGYYCYTPLGIHYTPEGMPVMRIDICPYWEYLGEGSAFCNLLQEEDPVLLGDQCKICDINMGDEEENSR
jgi:hypothetical protein